jgi:hypothetical protein
LSDDENEEDRTLLQSISKILEESKKKSKIDWYKHDCGGENCHGKSSCSNTECSCAIEEERNYPMLQYLCSHMVAMGNPYRYIQTNVSKEKWETFSVNFFNGNTHMIPPMFGKLADCKLEWGRFLREQWFFARNIYIKTIKTFKKSPEEEDVPLTPFLKQCKAVIDDRETYELEVTLIHLYKYINCLNHNLARLFIIKNIDTERNLKCSKLSHYTQSSSKGKRLFSILL